MFVADDLGAWLVGLLADASRKKLTALVLGSDQERALRKAAAVAVQDTAAEMSLSVEQASRLAVVIRKAFRKPVQDASLTGPVTVLELLQAGIVGQLAVPNNADPTVTGESSAEALGMPGAMLAEKLTGHLVREIMLRGSGGGPLTPLADQLNHDLTRLQGQRIEGMLARLAALVITASAPSADVARPAREVGPAHLAGAVRVGEADPRRLGVHAAISVPGVSDEILPEYVPRDVDATESGVRAKVATAAERGGFVLLVGGSSVGKTRCALEAVKALLPGWWMVHPVGPDQVTALAAAPRRTVVWLDELQRYLDGERGLTGGLVRALLSASAVIIGTLWPELYAAYTIMPVPGSSDPYAREREVLKLADVVRIGPAFSPAEQSRARAAAVRDPRLAVALESAGYGPTQTLAAAPQLVARWQDAQTADPYAWAVLTAALDAARLGARAPLGAELLRAAAPGYCTSRQQAEAPGSWFERALSYATGKLNGAAAALTPVGAGMGQVSGYIAADYLIQHANRERRYARVPASAWDAVLSHIRDPADAARLAGSAQSRLLYRYAIPLYRHAAQAGDGDSAERLASLLARRGDLAESAQVLRALADASYGAAALNLADLLVDLGDLDGLRARADAGDMYASFLLAGLLAYPQALRAAADAGGGRAARKLARLRVQADAGDENAARELARLLADRGDLELLRARADASDGTAAERLAVLLAYRGDLDELRTRADAGDEEAAPILAELLAYRGDLDELRTRADAGDRWAAGRLAELLAYRGDLDELRTRADAGDRWAAGRLADLLARRGDLDGAVQVLRARADVGDGDSAERLADLLAYRGDLDELRTRAGAGDRDSAERLARLLAWRGDLDELRTRAVGDGEAARELARLLADRGDLDELRTRADAGDGTAAWQLARLLGGRGDLDELRARADAGDENAARELARLLAWRGDLDELRTRAVGGDENAAWELARLLADLLIKQGRGEEAEQLRRFGLNPDGSIACA